LSQIFFHRSQGKKGIYSPLIDVLLEGNSLDESTLPGGYGKVTRSYPWDGVESGNPKFQAMAKSRIFRVITRMTFS